jgi:uncharacterized membrane protein
LVSFVLFPHQITSFISSFLFQLVPDLLHRAPGQAKVVVLAVHYLCVIIWCLLRVCPRVFLKNLAQKKRVQSWKMQAKETTRCIVKISTIFLFLTGLWVLFWKSNWEETESQSFMLSWKKE